MTWVKLDDGFFDNTVNRALGPAARDLFVASLCFCAKSLSDGKVSKTDLPLLLATAQARQREAQRLVEAGRWLDHGTHYEVAGYLTYNPSRADVEKERQRVKEWRDKRRDARVPNGVRNTVPNGVANDAPSRPVLTTETKSSNGSSQRAPQSDDDDLSEVWEHFATLRALRELDTPSAGWKATVARNARLELTEQARDLDARYELTRHELAQVLDAGTANSQILRYAKRKAPA